MAANRVRSRSGERLQVFYEEWLVRQQDLLDELLLASSEEKDDGDGHAGAGDANPRRREVIQRAVAHYQNYFEERNLIAGDDVFVVFSAPWLNAFERAYLWVAGIKPALIIRLVESGVGREGLTAEQTEGLDRLRVETGRSEREVVEALAAVQESVAAPPLVALLRRLGWDGGVDGEASTLDTAMERLRMAMAGVLEIADALRGTTMRRVLSVLRPSQAVKFLAAAAQFQLRLRRWGRELAVNAIADV